ncbi:hypothetical protein GGTG_14289 [Gaeumannomyces tritici R3-111a-1]|uniref:Uncharacterized protein n=1 Tax=Gaeumannomyces tritici (strain R3-111a-1) TaxID=644352 RepID=J3PL45_GAET3|nr:hypothetical protein GGTG_14289 [Gaeumannomyces tritici R3-111a-1]EJT68132.1 hypothetical protein GGTG_14289 [Gaeumannomyces tritici R3-111a-1]
MRTGNSETPLRTSACRLPKLRLLRGGGGGGGGELVAWRGVCAGKCQPILEWAKLVPTPRCAKHLIKGKASG